MIPYFINKGLIYGEIMNDVKKGLEKIVALETKLSYIDGEKGILEYRGYNINDLIAFS